MKTVLVNGTNNYEKDLCRWDESAVTEDDESDTSSGSYMGVMVTYESGQYSSAQLTSAEDTKHENDQTSGDRGNVGNLIEEHPTLPRRSTWQKRTPPPCHICDHEIRTECSENWDENHHSPQPKCQQICSTCKIYFLGLKKHGFPE